MAQLMPLTLTVTCFSKIQIGFTFVVLAHLGSPGQNPEGCKMVVVVVVVAVIINTVINYYYYYSLKENACELKHLQ